MWW
jgi:hypothetical protein